ncbi:TetR/AcrR family transcriptional regulator [Pseudalkalibacillus decolorationis]|uniref:TetR/AcrR family transcriptional regulator n=1 Tax=Pseudalkalibacillus decolorationis TaxID=163879 RepID=UPI002147E76A|nr:TetR/AcrR family transcriptional regulator [Pseudalkalibacillus decolorationis]
MNGFEQRKEIKKSQIRHAALKLLTELEKVSITDIAHMAEVSQVSIYNYFGSKEALLIDIMKDYMEKAITEYEIFLTKNVPFPEIIKAIMIKENEILGLMNACLKQNIEDNAFTEMVEEFQKQRLIPFFSKLMELGRELGYMEPDIKISDLLFYFSMYQKEMLHLSKGRVSISEERLVHLFFYGLIGRPK